MPRPILRDKQLEKVTLMLDRSALEEAQKKAINNGVELSKAGNASAFVRWLVDRFNGSQRSKI